GILDSTWGGSLADMVRFTQELKVVREENLLEAVPIKTAHLVTHLGRVLRKNPDQVHNLRGMGLYQGFSFRDPAMRNRARDYALQEENLFLMGAATDTIRLRPNLSVTIPEIDLLCEKLDRVLEAIA